MVVPLWLQVMVAFRMYHRVGKNWMPNAKTGWNITFPAFTVQPTCATHTRVAALIIIKTVLVETRDRLSPARSSVTLGDAGYPCRATMPFGNVA
jgi:hypothetical protein